MQACVYGNTKDVIVNYQIICILCFSCDSLVIITSIFMFSFTVFRHTGTYVFTYYYLHVYPYAVTVVYPIALCCQTGSAYLTLAVTLERYVAVCWSLKARHLCTQVWVARHLTTYIDWYEFITYMIIALLLL